MTPKAECRHPKIQFGSGDFYIFCYDCGRAWATINNSRNQISPELANQGVGNQLSGENRIASPAPDAVRLATIEALFEPETSHARDNLEGALYDIERYSSEGKPTNQICIRTINRVIDQLARAETILRAQPASGENE